MYKYQILLPSVISALDLTVARTLWLFRQNIRNVDPDHRHIGHRGVILRSGEHVKGVGHVKTIICIIGSLVTILFCSIMTHCRGICRIEGGWAPSPSSAAPGAGRQCRPRCSRPRCRRSPGPGGWSGRPWPPPCPGTSRCLYERSLCASL